MPHATLIHHPGGGSASEEELVDQVRITVLHEIGHHFGMSEQDLDELGYG